MPRRIQGQRVLDDHRTLAQPIDGHVRLTHTNRGVLARANLRTALAMECVRWFDWIALLRSNMGGGELLIPRVAASAAIVTAGALTNRRWTIPIAVWLALPVVWIESWVVLLAIIRLRERPEPVVAATPAVPAEPAAV